MKRKNLLLTFLLTATFVLGGGSMWAATEINGIYYNLYGKYTTPYAQVTYGSSSYNSYSGSVVIPSSVVYDNITYPVTQIGASAFRNCTDLTSVSLPDGIVSIGDMAFYGCNNVNFKSLTLPESVTSIGTTGTSSSSGRVFYNCTYLESINIPSGVSFIPISAFYQCSSLSSINMPSSVTSIGNYAFYQCSELSNIEIPSSVTSIGDNAFNNCSKLSSVNIPSGVTTIMQYTFRGCSSLTSIIIPASVNEIQSNAFYYCTNLASVTLLGTTPPSLYNATAFLRSSGLYPDFYVFKGYGNTYKGASNWSTLSGKISELSAITFEDLDLTNSVAALTIPSDFALTVTGTLTSPDASKLVIANSGQLICNNAVQATVQKNITGYGADDEVETGWYFIALPFTESFAPTAAMTSNTYDLYQLDPATAMWQNYKEHEGNAAAGFSLVNGRGYLYANSQDIQPLEVAGTTKPYDAGYTIPVSEGWNLVGNPYTFDAFINTPYYAMNSDGSGITATTVETSTAVKPCTGVIIKADEDGNVKFLNADPVSSANNSNLQVMLAYNVATRDGASVNKTLDNAIVSFNEGSQLEKFYFMEQNANLYIPQDGKEYAIANAQAQGEMPVNFKANENGQYTITVNPENVEMDYLHLVDNLTGADIDLLSTPSYTFNAKTTDYASRFRLLFAANGIEENGTSTSSAKFAFISNGQLIVNGTGTLQIIDMTGRVVSTKSTEERISTNELTPGVYVVKLIGNETKTQKIVIE